MSISGPTLGENHAASLEYGAVIYLVRERMENWLTEYKNKALSELHFLGSVTALRAIVEAEPVLASAMFGPDDVDAWSDAFVEWFTRFGKNIKIKKGVQRQAVMDEVVAEFARIRKALSKGIYKD